MSPMRQTNYFHLHLVSDATGETLLTVARAAAAQYTSVQSVEHIYSLVRNMTQLERVLKSLESEPGIVLYTLVDPELSKTLEKTCKALGIPCVSVLSPIFKVFQSYLGVTSVSKAGAQHVLNEDYFKRMEALNFTMVHDDGQHSDDLEDADVVLLGVSRTSKTPTSIYLANRGVKTANIPLIPGIDPPEFLLDLKKPLIVGLIASAERIVQIRRNRLLAQNMTDDDNPYVNRFIVQEELNQSRRFFVSHQWPMIDVTRKSIEETAAEIITHLQDRKIKSEEENAL